MCALPPPQPATAVDDSLPMFDSMLAARWQRTGEWLPDGARHHASAVDIATHQRVRIAAVFCARDGMATARLAREIGVLSALAHQPAVVPILATGRRNGWLYLVTPDDSDRCVAACLRRDGAMLIDEATALTIGIADLLHIAHGLGIAHGAINARTVALVDGQPRLGGFADSDRVVHGGDNTLAAARDVFALAAVLFEAVAGRAWRAGTPVPDTLPEPLQHVLQRALGGNPAARFPTAIAFAQALCMMRGELEQELVPANEVSGRDADAPEEAGEPPLSEGAERSLRVLHALLDQAEIAETPPDPGDTLVRRCWDRADAQVPADDARLVALRCRWRLLADRDPIGALAAAQAALHAARVQPYRARALAAFGRAAEARTVAVRAWFDGVAMDLSALRSLTMALLLTRAFDLASLVSSGESAAAARDPVIAAAGLASVHRGVAPPLSLQAQQAALSAIEEALNRGVPWTAELLVDPRWDPLRSNPHFAELVARSKSYWSTAATPVPDGARCDTVSA